MKEAQWYPGNMNRAMRQVREDLKLVDLVVELADARIPSSSRNPFLSRVIGNKQRLILLHKADRGEEPVTARWISYFQEQNFMVLPFSVHNPRAATVLFKLLRRQERTIRTGKLKRPLRLLIAGIPNVGKSTLINHLVKRDAARTGNQPGITRGRQWFRLLPGIELLDTPGILWPNISEETAFPLAVVGAIPASKLDLQNMAIQLLGKYVERGKQGELAKRYAGMMAGTPENLLEQIALSQGCLQHEGKTDLERAAAIVLRDFQSGALGRLSLEEPPKP